MKKILALVVVAAMVLCSTAAYAGGHWDKGDRKAHFEKMAQELGLTQEQKAALEQQKEAYFTKVKDLRHKMKDLKKELKQELDKPTPDRAKINATISQIQQISGQKMQIKVDKVLAMKQVLTSKQYEKMTQIMEKKKAQLKNKRGKHGMHGER